MKLKRLIEAQAALVKIKDIPIRNYRKRYEVYRLCRKVRDVLIWASEEERRLIQDIGGTLDGQAVTFPDAEKRNRFERDRMEMSETEIDMPGLPVVLDETDMDGIPLDVSAMMALEGIIEFLQPETSEKQHNE